ncbi:hypothetical protein DV735_g1055, partial [Chaetothyriales sp. CBS 134920]
MERREQRRKEQNRLAQKRYRENVRKRLRTLEQLFPQSNLQDVGTSKQQVEASLSPPKPPAVAHDLALSPVSYGDRHADSCVTQASTHAAERWPDFTDLKDMCNSAIEEPTTVNNPSLSLSSVSSVQSWTASYSRGTHHYTQPHDAGSPKPSSFYLSTVMIHELQTVPG